MPPVVVVQHTRNSDGKSLIKLLNRSSAIPVIAARDNDILQKGIVYVACGTSHVQILAKEVGLVFCFKKGVPINGHLPSIDATFESISRLSVRSVGVLLTGMGHDGAAGLKAMHDHGAWIITQSEQSCLVFGMPRQAIMLGASDVELSPGRIGKHLAHIAAEN